MRSSLRKMLGRPPKPAKAPTGNRPSAEASDAQPDIVKQYVHEPINYDTHVQLALVPPAADSDATLEVTLHTFPWDQIPGFTYVANSMAFSYETVSDINLCGELYLTTRSLDVFLRRVRRPDKQMPFMFIPALCMRPESIESEFAVIRRIQSRAETFIDAAAVLNRLDEAELARLNARSLQLPTGRFNVSAALLNRVAEHVRSKEQTGNFYPYIPLDRFVGEVRVLRMTRNKLDRSLPPDYALINMKLEDNMNFVPYSYTWGDDVNQQEIVIDGVAVKVRRNLHEILMQTAQTMRQVEPLDQIDCWFDAQCINQDDIAEKSIEIRRMSQVYAAAHCVHAWLGPGTAESEQVLAVFTDDDENSDTDEKGYMLMNKKRIEQEPDFYINLAKLVMRPFFTRAWCTQELAMARKVRVMAGRGMADWGSLASMSPAHTDWLVYLPLLAQVPAQPSERLAFFQGIPFARLQLVERLQRRRKSGRSTTLLSLLLATVHLDSTIAKDKIYSLWSMASDAAELLPEPNYDQSDEQVFFDFTKAWIMKYRRLDILATRAMQRERWVQGNIPTWVTDWSSHRLTRPFLSSYPSALRDEELDDVEHARIYDAAGNTGSFFGFISPDDPMSRLQTSGLSCDMIKSVGEANMGQYTPFNSWFENMAKERDASEQPMEVQRDFSDAMYANRDPTGVRMSRSDRFQDHDLDVVAIFNNEDQGDLEVGSLLWRHHIHQTISGRRLAVTHKGHLGLVPSEAEIGDEVAILFGCSVPLIFRQDPKGTKLIIGDCYFRRMMDGQMIEAAGGADYCMAHAMPGLEVPPEVMKQAAPNTYDVGSAVARASREVRNQQGLVFREPTIADTDETVMRLPSGKMLDPAPGRMKAIIPKHLQATAAEVIQEAIKMRPTPGEAVRIQPFVIA